VPLTGLALPHYLVLWRPVLIAAVAVGGTAGVGWIWRSAGRGERRTRRAVAVALGVVLATPAAVSTTRAIATISTLQPSGYAALPPHLRAGSTVWVVGDLGAARHALPGRQVGGYSPARRDHDPGPAGIVLDRGSTLRGGDGGLPAWASRHGYRYLHTGALDVWLAP
jgi:hypothetical protein